ncbi:hypothetical protein D027_1390B, partial [Vibrio parahaemolyticus 861]
IGCASVLIT